METMAICKQVNILWNRELRKKEEGENLQKGEDQGRSSSSSNFFLKIPLLCSLH